MLVKPKVAASAGGLPLLLLAASWGAGCGGDDSPRPVSLSLTAPADAVVVHEDAVEVQGRVRPTDAQVRVGGRSATVRGGEFRARVPLREGPNVIDVAASAEDARPAWATLRVARETLVRVPEVAGAGRDDAVDRLESAGLRAEVVERSGLLDRLLPGEWGVCETEPRAGAELARGATVHLVVSKTC